MAYVVTRNQHGLAGVRRHRPRSGTRPRPVGLGTSGVPAALVTGDRVKIFQAQRNEARQLFGESMIPIAGRTDVREPALSPEYARKLLDYWIDDTKRVYDGMTATQLIFGSAIQTVYFNNLGTMRKLRSTISGAFVGDALMVRIWKALNEAALTGFAIETTPKPWQLLVEAIHEAIDDLPKPPSFGDITTLLKVAVGGVAVVLAYQIYNNARKR